MNQAQICPEAMMNDKRKTKAQLIEELQELRQRVRELEGVVDKPLGLAVGAGCIDKPSLAVLNHLKDVVVIQNLEMEIEWANRAAYESLGLSAEEVVGKHCYEVWGKRNDPCHNCPAVSSREIGHSYKAEITRHDGKIWIVESFPVVNEHGDLHGTVEICRDISELHHAERALSESEQMFDSLFRASPTPVGITSFVDGRFLDVNDAVIRLTGYTREELIGNSAIDLGFWDDEDSRREFQESLINTGRYLAENPIKTKSGEVRIGIWSAELLNLSSEPVIITNFTDITERKRAEKALREREKMFSTAFHVSPVAIAITSIETGEFMQVNDAFCRLTGYKREDLIGRTVKDTGICHEKDQWVKLNGKLDYEGHVHQEEIIVRVANGGSVVGMCSAAAIELNSVPCMICVMHDVTDRRIAQLALAESETTLRAILMASPIGIGMVKNRQMQWANNSMSRIIGYKSHEYIAKNTRFLYENDEEFKRVGDVLYATGSDINETDARMVRSNGEVFFVHVVSQQVDPANASKGHIIALMDITERKQAEVALADSEETLRTIFSASPIGISLLEKGHIVWVNSAALEMVGYRHHDMLGKRVDFIYPNKEEAQRVDRWVSELIARKETGSFETQWVRSDGGLIDCLVRVTPLYREGRKPQVLVIAADISERKNAERALRESEAKLRAAFEAAGDVAFVITDSIGPESPVRDYSPGAQRVFGYTKQDVIGQPISMLGVWDALGNAQEMDGGLEEVGPGFTHEVILARKNGESFPALIGVYPLMESDDTMIGTLVIAMDQTERKRAERRAQEQQQQLAQAAKMASLGTLVSGVAHEINNPILSVILNAPALKKIWRDLEPFLDEYKDEHGDFEAGGFYYHELVEEVPALIENIHDGARRVKSIVADLKSYSRETPLDTNEAVHINDAMQAAISLTNNLINKSTDHFSVSLAEDLPAFRGNVQRVEQVLINLLVNSCEALPSPDRGISVRTYYNEPDDSVMVVIRDQGVGISEDVLGRVTDPFFTTKRDSGGTGLGLSVSAGIMEHHGGKMIIEPRYPTGVIVSLSFPAISESEKL